MIDVGNKPFTQRLAIAEGCIHVGAEAFDLIAQGKLPKGNALMLAEMAGIQGVKMTSQLIPLCHPLNIDQVLVNTALDPEHKAIRVYCRVSAYAKTGVEMEALAGVNAALLCIYDLTKMIEPALTMDSIRLVVKVGGKQGVWIHPEGIPTEIDHLLPDIKNLSDIKNSPHYDGIKVSIIKTSDRAAHGIYEDADELKHMLQNKLIELGMVILEYKVLPNEEEQLKNYLLSHIDTHAPDLIITLGGTGLSKRDTTPETVAQLCDRQIPGLSELLRIEGSKFNQYAWLSRSIVGIIQNSLIITFPGKPKAAHEAISILQNILHHALKSIRGYA